MPATTATSTTTPTARTQMNAVRPSASMYWTDRYVHARSAMARPSHGRASDAPVRSSPNAADRSGSPATEKIRSGGMLNAAIRASAR